MGSLRSKWTRTISTSFAPPVGPPWGPRMKFREFVPPVVQNFFSIGFEALTNRIQLLEQSLTEYEEAKKHWSELGQVDRLEGVKSHSKELRTKQAKLSRRRHLIE